MFLLGLDLDLIPGNARNKNGNLFYINRVILLVEINSISINDETNDKAKKKRKCIRNEIIP